MLIVILYYLLKKYFKALSWTQGVCLLVLGRERRNQSAIQFVMNFHLWGSFVFNCCLRSIEASVIISKLPLYFYHSCLHPAGNNFTKLENIEYLNLETLLVTRNLSNIYEVPSMLSLYTQLI